MNRKILTLTLILGLLTATALAVYAETATVTIGIGNLTFSTDNISLSAVTLDGTDQTSTSPFGDNSWSVIDARGSGGGWNVTIDSTDFDDAGTNSIDISAAGSEFKIQLTNITVTAGSAAPTSLVSSLTTIPTAPATALKFLSAADTGGVGMGSYSVQPNFELGVPAETYAASYSATLTLTGISGP